MADTINIKEIDSNEDEETLFIYGRYSVHELTNRGYDLIEDKDNFPLNFGVFNDQLDTCEAKCSSLPQAMGMAVGFDRSIDKILEDVDQELAQEQENSTIN